MGDGVVTEVEARFGDVVVVGGLEDAELGAARATVGVHFGGVGCYPRGDGLHVYCHLLIGVVVEVGCYGVCPVGGGEECVLLARRGAGDGAVGDDGVGRIVGLLVLEAVEHHRVVWVGVDYLVVNFLAIGRRDLQAVVAAHDTIFVGECQLLVEAYRRALRVASRIDVLYRRQVADGDLAPDLVEEVRVLDVVGEAEESDEDLHEDVD